MSHLFTKEQAPRSQRKKRMRLQDVGASPFPSESGKEAFYVSWKCPHCEHDAGWQHFEGTVSDVKRGIPCPKCNPSSECVK